MLTFKLKSTRSSVLNKSQQIFHKLGAEIGLSVVCFILICVISVFIVCEIPRSFERLSPSTFRTQGSFIHINSGKIFERDLLSSDSVAKSATQKRSVF